MISATLDELQFQSTITTNLIYKWLNSKKKKQQLISLNHV